jgi:hypothetical protein
MGLSTRQSTSVLEYICIQPSITNSTINFERLDHLINGDFDVGTPSTRDICLSDGGLRHLKLLVLM